MIPTRVNNHPVLAAFELRENYFLVLCDKSTDTKKEFVVWAVVDGAAHTGYYFGNREAAEMKLLEKVLRHFPKVR